VRQRGAQARGVRGGVVAEVGVREERQRLAQELLFPRRASLVNRREREEGGMTCRSFENAVHASASGSSCRICFIRAMSSGEDISADNYYFARSSAGRRV
jgi:hypothetical protein